MTDYKPFTTRRLRPITRLSERTVILGRGKTGSYNGTKEESTRVHKYTVEEGTALGI